jgi:hypothetical protein
MDLEDADAGIVYDDDHTTNADVDISIEEIRRKDDADSGSGSGAKDWYPSVPMSVAGCGGGGGSGNPKMGLGCTTTTTGVPRTTRARESKEFSFDDPSGLTVPTTRQRPLSASIPTSINVNPHHTNGASGAEVKSSSHAITTTTSTISSSTIRAKLPHHLQLQQNRSDSANSNSNSTDRYKLSDFESPRIPVPPNHGVPSLVTSGGSSSSSGNGNGTWGTNRPQSAERRRWMARVSLLKETQGDAKVTQLADYDHEQVGLSLNSSSKYIHLEYLPWMGTDLPAGVLDDGDIVCPSCSRVLGSWAWNSHPRHTLGGKLEAPVIRILKSVVTEADLPMDQTPITTPRPDNVGGGGGGGTPRGSSAQSTPRTPRNDRSRSGSGLGIEHG